MQRPNLSPLRGDIVDSGKELSYRPAGGQKRHPMPESTISSSQGLRIWLELSFIAGINAKPNIISSFPRANTTQSIRYLKSTPAPRLELGGGGRGRGVHFPSFPLDYFEIIIGRERRQASPGLRAKSNIQMMPPPILPPIPPPIPFVP